MKAPFEQKQELEKFVQRQTLIKLQQGLEKIVTDNAAHIKALATLETELIDAHPATPELENKINDLKGHIRLFHYNKHDQEEAIKTQIEAMKITQEEAAASFAYSKQDFASEIDLLKRQQDAADEKYKTLFNRAAPIIASGYIMSRAVHLYESTLSVLSKKKPLIDLEVSAAPITLDLNAIFNAAQPPEGVTLPISQATKDLSFDEFLLEMGIDSSAPTKVRALSDQSDLIEGMNPDEKQEVKTYIGRITAAFNTLAARVMSNIRPAKERDTNEVNTSSKSSPASPLTAQTETLGHFAAFSRVFSELEMPFSKKETVVLDSTEAVEGVMDLQTPPPSPVAKAGTPPPKEIPDALTKKMNDVLDRLNQLAKRAPSLKSEKETVEFVTSAKERLQDVEDASVNEYPQHKHQIEDFFKGIWGGFVAFLHTITFHRWEKNESNATATTFVLDEKVAGWGEGDSSLPYSETSHSSSSDSSFLEGLLEDGSSLSANYKELSLAVFSNPGKTASIFDSEPPLAPSVADKMKATTQELRQENEGLDALTLGSNKGV